MKTRCPNCDTLYNIDRSLLKQARGLARCYHCGEVFNALRSGSEGHQAASHETGADDHSKRPREPMPEAQPPFEVPADLPLLEADAIAELKVWDNLHPGTPRSAPWWQKSLLALLLLLLIAQIAWLQREYWINLPQVAQVCSWLRCTLPAKAHPEAFSVVGHEMRASAGTPPVLGLQLSYRNNASYPLRLPRLQISLFDGNGALVTRRILDPQDYLPSSWSGPAVAFPQEVITIQLNFVDPGPRIRSYVFDFL